MVENNRLSLIKTIGKRGKEDGEFNYPSYLALDSKGRLFVVDSLIEVIVTKRIDTKRF